MYNLVEKHIDLGDGRVITLETGRLAKQADGSVLVKCGKAMMLATVVAAKDAKEDIDFMPLSVEYQEKFASIGRIPGSFMKREGRPSDHEILIARLVDRVLRPLFPKNYHAEVFVTIYLLSADVDVPPDALAGLAASAALTISDIPFNGPISEVRIARVEGELKINPSFIENDKADIDIMLGATYENIMMVEGEMNEVSEADMLEAIKFGHEAIKKQCTAQKEFAEMLGNKPKREYNHETNDEDLRKLVHAELYQKIYDLAKQTLPKHERSDGFDAIRQTYIDALPLNEKGETDKVKANLVKRYFHDEQYYAVRNLILDEGIRLDGRKTDQIRPIWCEVDCLPSAHGSAIFTRGETQSITTVTLGTKLDEKIIDEVHTQGRDKFMLHYNFPPFATGEARPSRGVSRREIGHGNLAHRALKRMIPKGIDNPYTLRIVSDILESNGSSSMATVCAATLALMDSGIKLAKPVSGIAMGLITDNITKKWAVLSDILGDEDHLGDMDFKVTGTIDGITACQMDIKVDGLSYEIMEKALEQAKQGRHFILGKLLETLSAPREDYKPFAPRVVSILVPKEMIGAIIGTGGKIIQQIQSETNTVITIEEVDGKGKVDVIASDKAAIDLALEAIYSIIEEPEIGKTYKGKIKSIVSFGAFVEFMRGKEGLLHISEIDHKRINAVEDVLKDGEIVEVKLIEFDKKTGKYKLSRKALLPRPERSGSDSDEHHDRGERHDRSDRGDRGDRGHHDNRSNDRGGRDDRGGDRRRRD